MTIVCGAKVPVTVTVNGRLAVVYPEAEAVTVMVCGPGAMMLDQPVCRSPKKST